MTLMSALVLCDNECVVFTGAAGDETAAQVAASDHPAQTGSARHLRQGTTCKRQLDNIGIKLHFFRNCLQLC